MAPRARPPDRSIRPCHRRQRLHRHAPGPPAGRGRLPRVLPGSRGVARRRIASDGRATHRLRRRRSRGSRARHRIVERPPRVPSRRIGPGDARGRLRAGERRGRRGGRAGVRRPAGASGPACWSRRSRRRGPPRTGRASRATRRCRSRTYGRSKRAGEKAAMRHAAALPITIVRPSVVFGAGDQGMLQAVEADRAIGIARRRRRWRPSRIARRRGGSRPVPRARGGARRAARSRRPGTRHLLRRRGGSFARRPRHRVRAGAREAAAPRSPPARMVAADDRTIRRRDLANPPAPGLGRQRQGPRDSGRLVDVLVGEGAHAARLVAGGPARRSASRNRTVVPRGGLGLRGRGSGARGESMPRRDTPAGRQRRAATARGRRSGTSWRASFRACATSRASCRCSRAPRRTPSS